jgi:hypothetical protein
MTSYLLSLHLPCHRSLTHQIRACHSVGEGYELFAAPFPDNSWCGNLNRVCSPNQHCDRAIGWVNLDGAKILILWIEKSHLQRVPKFVDR